MALLAVILGVKDKPALGPQGRSSGIFEAGAGADSAKQTGGCWAPAARSKLGWRRERWEITHQDGLALLFIFGVLMMGAAGVGGTAVISTMLDRINAVVTPEYRIDAFALNWSSAGGWIRGYRIYVRLFPGDSLSRWWWVVNIGGVAGLIVAAIARFRY